MPVDRAAWGQEALLLLFTDPLESATGSVVKMLRLLGLSPSEARIAVLVGTGHSPKEVAAELRITENTVRSVLKTIYGKLSVSRQSELAQMVARLGSL
jgi:DNA-binding CsgD family transcriptional regulator